jgi:NADPH-dependent F420 reductase
MTIGILGTGNVASTLGGRFAELGHEIVYGSRDTTSAKVADLMRGHVGSVRAASPDEMAAGADLVLLAVPFAALETALPPLADRLRGKIVVDATNPILPRLAGLSHGRDDSGAEHVARLLPGARVVKAFNTVGYQVMASPEMGGTPALLPVAADDAGARETVCDLARAVGFDAIDFGPLSNARYTEPLAMVWITLAHVQKWGPDFAFALIRR